MKHHDSMTLAELTYHYRRAVDGGDSDTAHKILAAIDRGWPRAQETPTSKCAPCPGDASEDVCKRTHGPCDATPRAPSVPMLTIPDDERAIQIVMYELQYGPEHDEDLARSIVAQLRLQMRKP